MASFPRICGYLGIVIGAALVSQAALSQTPSHALQAPLYLLGLLRNDLSLEAYLKIARDQFVYFDADGDGRITGADDDLHALVAASSRRAGMVLSFINADLDGDGAVSADEVRRFFTYQRRLGARHLGQQGASQNQQTETAIATFMKADADGDGRITFAEMLAAARAFEEQIKARPNLLPGQLSRQVASFDSNGDGAVSLAEFEAAYESLFRTVDADGNGVVSSDELTSYRNRLMEPSEAIRRDAEEAAKRRDAARQIENAEQARQEQQRQAAARERVAKIEQVRTPCVMPKASSSAKVILLGGYETDALSNTTLGSQDVVVQAGTIIIEAGSEPLYLVVSTYAAEIWQFTGATDRIEHLVLATAKTLAKNEQRIPLVGATGLPASRITFLSGTGCLPYFSEAPSIAATATASKVAEQTGKAADIVIGRYQLGSISLPSGAIKNDTAAKPPLLIVQKSVGTLTIEGDAKAIVIRTPSVRDLAVDLLRYNPGGIIAIDPAAVVGAAPAQAYDVPPQQAGLIKLSQKGALTQNRSGEYLIHEKIRYPAGLAGGHSVKFLLLKGVPEPDGDPGHSDVISEETGQLLTRK
jgi:Ca2+-binding EF-hand superfamily protein